MNKLLIASTMSIMLGFSVSSQAGIYDYSRTTVGQGELIHEATENSMNKHQMKQHKMDKHSNMSANKSSMSNRTLWQWDDVIYK